MDPVGIGRGAGAAMGGFARLVLALRGTSPAFEVEATHYPAKPEVPCTDCDHPVEHAQHERIFVQAIALTGTHYRVRAAGFCKKNWLVRKLRQWPWKAAWREMEIKPVGGHHGKMFDPDRLRQLGEHRRLPATIKHDDPLSFNVMIPADLPRGFKRGRPFRVWVGKPLKGGLVSDPFELPKLQPQDPPTPRRCFSCDYKLKNPELFHHHRHHHHGSRNSPAKPGAVDGEGVNAGES